MGGTVRRGSTTASTGVGEGNEVRGHGDDMNRQARSRTCMMHRVYKGSRLLYVASGWARLRVGQERCDAGVARKRLCNR